ncbi:MAG: 5'-nucleotidase C-terminal domain-containing protein [Defluviitaleaceae bacterium]|nr:5'-nucleotidase C-terminal domain-containing protein [Defluviitaleaceae bacterium]MCL2239648.1 5'-nucleotidase C-terminal domain-containing protein [Defluviitaleaceae bacterium]
MKRIKPILAAVLVLVLVAALSAIPTRHMAAAPEGSVTIRILHTNDVHGRFIGTEPGARTPTIGIDRIAAIYAATVNAILVDAGDAITGMPFVTLTQGINAINLMNAAGYRLMVTGNHEYNYGIDRLLELENYADFAFLAANVAWRATGELVFDAYEIIEIDGVRVGFFGLATPETPIRTHPNNVVDLTFGDPIAAARLAVSTLQTAGAEVIVAITHLGLDGNAVIDVAEAVAGIHVIIDGHCHTELPTGRRVGDVLIAQTGEHGANLGVVEIVVSNAGVSATASLITHEMAQEFAPDPAVSALIEEMNAALNPILDRVVGYNPVFLSGDRALVRVQEAALGNVVADALRWDVDADLAMMNSGGIRASLPAGDITKRDVLTVLEFPNYTVKMEITAAQLWQAMEIAVGGSGGDAQPGQFPQISGFSFVYDVTAPVGSRVEGVRVGGRALNRNDHTTTFSFAVPDFLANGGDGFALFMDLPVLAEGILMADLFIAYLAEGHISGAAVEGRITRALHAPVFFLPVPVAGQDLRYTAQKGETLWSIAYNFYGSMNEALIRRIFAANAEALRENHGAVVPGMVLTLPAAGLRDPITRTHAGELHLVRAGDTLGSIAYAFFGNTAYANVIFEANRARVRNVNRIIEGQWIVVPA